MNRPSLRHPACLTALAIMVACSLGMTSVIRAFGLYLQKKEVHPDSGRMLHAITPRTANWTRLGEDDVFPNDIITELGTTNYVSRRYIERDPPPHRAPYVLDFHAAYYTGMIDTVPHVPDRCFIGGGMQRMASAQVIPIRLDDSDWVAVTDVPSKWAGEVYTTRLSSEYGDGRGRRVTLPRKPHDLKMRLGHYADSAGRDIWAGYFFIANGGHVASAEGVRLLAFNLTDDYAYYLKVQVTSTQVRSEEEFAAVATSLLNDLMGEIMWCVPDWLLVDRGDWPPDNPRRGAGRAEGGTK